MRKFNISFLSFFLAFIVCGQEEQPHEKIPITSPNVTGLGQYIDFPVNHHTGVPQINIPIYTVQEGPINLPVSLSYHAGGLKVNQPSSWVGAGWSLNAGGMISRSAQGLFDEKQYFGKSFLRDNGYTDYFLDGLGRMALNDLAAGRLDGEPDIFYFNFGGYSGKFYIREDHSPMIIPHQDIKIQPLYCTNPTGQNCSTTSSYLRGWILTTPDGTKYHFGLRGGSFIGDQPYEKIFPYYFTSGEDIPETIGSWFLYKVESADDQFSVELTYTQEEYSHYSLAIGGAKPYGNSAYSNLVKNSIQGVRLTSIDFSNGKVDFIPDTTDIREDLSNFRFGISDGPNTEAYALWKIKISGTASDMCKVFEFDYGYFNDTTTPLPNPITTAVTRDKKRLKLNSLQEKSCDGTVVIPARQFSYYDELMVPRILTYALDHWGHYNGATSNTWVVPPVSADGGSYFYPGADREASWPEMRAGTIKSITHPTGGSTEYIYGYDVTTTSRLVTDTTYAAETTKYCYVDGSFNGQRCPSLGYSYSFTVSNTTVFKMRVTSLTSGGSYYIQKNGTTIKTLYSGPGSGYVEDIFTLSPGNYDVYGQSNNGSGFGQGVRLDLWRGTINTQNVTTDHIVSGLRIDNIKHKESNGTTSVEKFYDYPGGPILFSIPKYIYLLRSEANGALGLAGEPQYTSTGCRLDGNYTYLVSPSSIIPMQTSQGAHKGYEYVREYQTGNGYVEYKFDVSGALAFPDEGVSVRSIPSGCPSTGDYYPPAPLPNNFRRGSLLNQKVVDESGNLLKETIYNPVYQEDPYGVFGVKTHEITSPSTPIHVTWYDMKSGRKVSEIVTEKTYNPDDVTDFVATTQEMLYESEIHNSPTKQSTYEGTSASGTALNSRLIQYVQDLTSCEQSCSSCVSTLNSALSTALSNYNYNMSVTCVGGGGNCSSLKGCIAGYDPCDITADPTVGCKVCAYTNYKVEVNEAYEAYVDCMISNCSDGEETACLNNKFSLADNELDALLTLHLQNNMINPVEVTSLRNENVVSSTYTEFDRDISNNASRIYPRYNYRINTDTPIPNNQFDPATSNTSTVITDTDYDVASEASYKYSEGRIVEVIGRDQVYTSYIWGHSNNYPIVKAVGVNHFTLSTAYTAVGGNLNTLRNQASLADALVTTYEYDPLIGMTAQTGPDGLRQTFEYDDLGRLLKVKDQNGDVLKQYSYNYNSSN